MQMKKIVLLLCLLVCIKYGISQDYKAEPHRPQFHFSPKKYWMNDPNGMVYYNGVYHLFFQYYPGSTKWGPMHWGHATSKDLIHWEEQPIALYPDSLGYIFSGSAVVDVNNTSGFGKNGKAPLVAIFTHHNVIGEQAKKIDYQYQSIAYSLDEGKTWTKYEGNPVVKNPGIIDFRDPKVMWYEPQKEWIMTLATKDRITFYSSPDLKTWNRESDFGKDLGAHGGVWECPDLFPLEHNGKKVWVLLVSINPGGPNGGSGTQYFLGNFDGQQFTPVDTATRWIDYGTDNYAGVTFSNTGKRTIFMGWMSNWQYAQEVPTANWRSAMTIPRDLEIKTVNNKEFLVSKPIKELNKIGISTKSITKLKVNGSYDLSTMTGKEPGKFRVDFTVESLNDFAIVLANKAGDELVVGYDKKSNEYYIDRTKSGKTDFELGFAKVHRAHRLSTNKNSNFILFADVASMELFADDGLTVMTDIFFPQEVLSKLYIKSTSGISIKNLKYTNLGSTLK